MEENVDMQDASPAQHEKNDEASKLYDSEYSFHNEEQGINEANDDVNGSEIVTQARNEGLGAGCHVHEEEEPNSNYGEFG